MIQLAEIRRPIMNFLRTHSGYQVIMGDTTGDAPSYPYTSLKFTLSGIKSGLPREEVTLLNNVGTLSYEQDMEFVISITCHGKDNESSFDLAFNLQSYLTGKGSLDLSSSNIVVVECTPVTNRDVYLTIEYERNYGFDLRIRVGTKGQHDIDIISDLQN